MNGRTPTSFLDETAAARTLASISSVVPIETLRAARAAASLAACYCKTILKC